MSLFLDSIQTKLGRAKKWWFFPLISTRLIRFGFSGLC